MNAATREKLIMMALPAVMVALGWWGWFRPTTKLTALQRLNSEARAAAPSEDAVQQEQANLGERSSQLAALRKEQDGYLQRWHRLKSDLAAERDRPAALETLIGVCQAHQVTILDVKRSPTRAIAGVRRLDELVRKLHQPLETAFPDLKSSLPAVAGNTSAVTGNAGLAAQGGLDDATAVWSLELAGTYEDVQQALLDLARKGLAFMPVHLAMAETNPALKLRRWTLVITL